MFWLHFLEIRQFLMSFIFKYFPSWKHFQIIWSLDYFFFLVNFWFQSNFLGQITFSDHDHELLLLFSLLYFNSQSHFWDWYFVLVRRGNSLISLALVNFLDGIMSGQPKGLLHRRDILWFVAVIRELKVLVCIRLDLSLSARDVFLN